MSITKNILPYKDQSSIFNSLDPLPLHFPATASYHCYWLFSCHCYCLCSGTFDVSRLTFDGFFDSCILYSIFCILYSGGGWAEGSFPFHVSRLSDFLSPGPFPILRARAEFGNVLAFSRSTA